MSPSTEATKSADLNQRKLPAGLISYLIDPPKKTKISIIIFLTSTSLVVYYLFLYDGIFFCSIFSYIYFARESDSKVLWWARLCVSVCPRGYLRRIPRNHMRDLYHLLCMLPIAVPRSSSGGVTSWRNLNGKGQLWGFSSPLTVQHNIWDPYKNGRTDRDAVWGEYSGGPWVPCVRWRTQSPRGNGIFWKTQWPIVK